MKRFFIAVAAVSTLAIGSTSWAQDVPSEYQQVLTTLGKQGDYKANVLKVNIPRNDLSVTVANVKTPTPFGFGGWVAMSKGTGGMDVMMGDLVLTQDEVNPVMSALLDNGLDVTALHNHFFREEPRIYYMHVHGHGTPAELAAKLKPALDLIGKGAGRPAATAGTAPAASGAKIDTTRDRADRRDARRTDRRRVQDHHRPRRPEDRGDGCTDQCAHGSQHVGRIRRDRMTTPPSPGTWPCLPAKSRPC